MSLLWITLALLLGYVVGASAVYYLTGPPHHKRRYLGLSILCSALAAVLSFGPLDGGWTVAGLLAWVAGAAGGYGAQAHDFLTREDSRYVPEITRATAPAGGAGAESGGHTAVLFFNRGEAENYDPTGLRAELRTLDELHRPRARFLGRPFLVAALRERYEALGRSEQRVIHRRMLKALERRARAQGDASTRFYLAYMDDEPRPDTAAIQAINDGAARIVVLTVFVAETAHLAAGMKMIDALDLPGRFGVEVTATEPLADSARLQSLFGARARAALADDPVESSGVLLVGHGGRETRAAEERFLAGARAQLVEAGWTRVAIGWMDARDPSAAAALEHLIADGAQRILYFAATSSADGLWSRFELPHSIARARVPAEVETVNLGAWNDDPIAIDALWDPLAPLL